MALTPSPGTPSATELEHASSEPAEGTVLRAVIFDVDGTLVDTERDGHRVAFNEAFRAAGLNYQWGVPEYGELLSLTGGRRRLAHYLRSQGHPPDEADALAETLHRDKTRRFATMIQSGALRPRAGTAELIAALRDSGVATAIATTGTTDWVLPLLDTLFGREMFDVVVTGSDITDLKPDPAAYLEALTRLEVPGTSAVSIEDSDNGVRAAVAAGLRCVAIVNNYTRDQALPGATAVLDDISRPEGVSVLRGDPELRHGLTVTALRRVLTTPS